MGVAGRTGGRSGHTVLARELARETDCPYSIGAVRAYALRPYVVEIWITLSTVTRSRLALLAPVSTLVTLVVGIEEVVPRTVAGGVRS